MTLPLIYALENVRSGKKANILRLIRHHNKNSQKVRDVIRFVKEAGGIQYSTQKMNEYINKALDILNKFPESEAKSSLQKLALYTASRVK